MLAMFPTVEPWQQTYLWPLLFVIALWAGLTCGMLWLNRHPPDVGRRVLVASLLLVVPACWYLAYSRHDGRAIGHYAGFAAGMLVYAWNELAFYTGALTGPRPSALPANTRGWHRFWHACGTHLYHDLVLGACGLMLWMLQYGGSNRTGLLTFLLLWVMQRSAKLNVLLGVRNLQVELLPQHLHYLASYWRRRPTNLFFFPSVVAGMALAGWCLVRAGQLAPNGAAVGLTLLGCLTALAVLEHWMLVLPWPRKEV